MKRTKEVWVDSIKAFACILVVLGHFLQSMVKSDILPDTALYGWFNQTIYYFHVPLFFICSGYLFQKFSKVRSFAQWGSNFFKKLVSLAVPYLVFSLATYLMKTVFSDAVNKASGGLIDTLFLNPTSPYWYLYALIFIFLITITIKNNCEALIFIAVALAMKVVTFFVDIDIYAINTVLENEIWFVLGMLVCYVDAPARHRGSVRAWCGWAFAAVFVAMSVLAYIELPWSEEMAFLMGVIGCVSVLMISFRITKSGRVLSAMSKYTFPVFLMHTIFAAGLRSVLLKIGITSSVIHVVSGLIISFAGPVIVALVLEKLKYAELLLYPNKFIRIGAKDNGKEA
ncbi:MAG: acyltransferase [Clostridia bacterium]|nr:acyltransferase [Clostridia bacterium]